LPLLQLGAVADEVTIRRAQLSDAEAIATMHIASWRETYAGLMPDGVLTDPGLLPGRQRFWRSVLSDARFAASVTVVAMRDGAVVGVAMAGPPIDLDEQPAGWQLYVLYLLAAEQGRGIGRRLLELVVEPGRPAQLWVAEQNPRAQSFYGAAGFVADGAVQVELGVRAIRMVRR